MFRDFYQRFIVKRLFGKIILIYTLIIVFVLTALASAVLGNYSSTMRTSAANDSKNITHTVQQFFSQKLGVAKLIQQLPYYRSETYGGILSFLSQESTSYNAEYITQKGLLDQYCQYACDLDPSILAVHMYSVNSSSIYRYYTTNNKIIRINNQNPQIFSTTANKQEFMPALLPANSLYPADSTQPSSVAIAANIRTYDMSSVLGTMFITIRLSELDEQLSQLQSDFAYHVVVYNKDGELLYNSFPDNPQIACPTFSELCSSLSDESINNTSISSIIHDDASGIYAACLIDNKTISDSYRSYRRLTILIMILCIVIAITLSFMIMRGFSNRITSVCSAMELAQSGDLSQRIQISGEDEISLIASSFNMMCDHLSHYIEKVYISDLKQKDAEIRQKKAEQYALQSQINPHFLYNTLEAIRMNSLDHHDTETAHMIYLLGSLFRSSINQKMYISIHDEITYCDSYMSLLQLRYKDRLTFSFSIDSKLYQYSIARHILQPLLENSILHGIDPDKPVTSVTVSGSMSNHSTIQINICDTGIGISEEELTTINTHLHSSFEEISDSIGIANVNQRIKSIYGEDFGIEIKSIVSEGTTITVVIPAKTIKEMTDKCTESC